MQSPPDERPVRRFNLGDGLIFICASAITLVLLRSEGWFERLPARVVNWGEQISVVSGWSPWHFPMPSRPSIKRELAVTITGEFIIVLSCVLVGLTLVLPLIRLRPPRPPWKKLVRQPGFVVCTEVVIGTVILVDLAWAGLDVAPTWVLSTSLLLLWPVLGLPPWRAESTWVDRLGRAVGWGWILAMVCVTGLVWLA